MCCLLCYVMFDVIVIVVVVLFMCLLLFVVCYCFYLLNIFL